MSLRLRDDQLAAIASFNARHRAELLTIVFTDVVGSTRLKQDLGDSEALRRIQEHHDLVRKVLRDFPTGLEVNTQGDSFFLAFARPSEAVRFALQLQVRVAEWSRRFRHGISDRIGIHVGEVLRHTGRDAETTQDLNGLEVDKCSRVMSLASGGRILLTRAAHDMARGVMRRQSIEGVGTPVWKAHGLYELRGIADPVEICEVAPPRFTRLPPPADSDKARRIHADSEAEDSGTISRRSLTIGGLLGASLGSLLLLLGGPLSHLSLELAYLVRRKVVPDEAVIIRMDEASHRALGQKLLTRWDRSLHAQLVERLTSYGAAAIVLDAFFHGTNDPVSDAALIEAARRHGRVAVAAAVDWTSELGIPEVRLLPPFDGLRDVVRWGPVYTRSSVGERFPGFGHKRSLPDEALRMLLQTDVQPASSRRECINFYGPAGTIRSFGYAEVLAGKVPGATFTNRVVLVGLDYRGPQLPAGRSSGDVHGDNLRTPYTLWTGELTTGVEVVATALINLMRGDMLTRLAPWQELAILAAIGLILPFLLAPWKPLAALAAAVSLSVFAAAIGVGMVWWTHVWFPWLIATAVQVPLALVWCILLRLEHARARPGRLESIGSDSQSQRGEGATPSAGPAGGERGDWPVHAPRDLIADHELIRVIGRGAYGEVWLGRSTLGHHHAIKFVRRNSFADAAPFNRELEGIRRFMPVSRKHPGLVHVLHVGGDPVEGWFCYVMELADDMERGQNIEPAIYRPRTLDSVLSHHGPFTADEAGRIVLRIAEALAFLHENGLMHRDVKPANILFVGGQPKLADAGLVTRLPSSNEEITRIGTHGFLPPEGPGTPQADVYALGKVLYVALTGRPLRDFPSLPDDIGTQVNAPRLLALNQVVLKACEREPSARYKSMQDMVMDLRRHLESGRDPTRPAAAL